MNPTQHPSNNHVIGAPKDWDQKETTCSALALTVMEVEGQPCLASFWRPTAEELRDLADGGLVMLMVFGHGMPPVSIGTTPRF